MKNPKSHYVINIIKFFLKNEFKFFFLYDMCKYIILKIVNFYVKGEFNSHFCYPIKPDKI